MSKEKLEAALEMTAFATIPYTWDVFVEAINLRHPPIFHKPALPVSSFLEDFDFHLSKDTHRKSKPEHPTDAWNSVYKR